MINQNYEEKYVIDIINKNFLKSKKKKYKSYNHAIFHINDDTDAWFGKIKRDKNGKFIENKSCGWTNEDYGNTFIMYTTKSLTQKEEKRLLKEDGKLRLIFAKDKGSDKYKFYGVYKSAVTINKNKAEVKCIRNKRIWP